MPRLALALALLVASAPALLAQDPPPEPAPAPPVKEDKGDQPAKKWTADALRKMYVAYLTKRGYQPRVDADGDVVFKIEDSHYFIEIDAEDPEFFRLVLPNFWSIDSAEERTRAHRASTRATLETKVAKIYVVNKSTWASVELLLPEPTDFAKVFDRSISVIHSAIALFVRVMREDEKKGEGEKAEPKPEKKDEPKPEE